MKYHDNSDLKEITELDGSPMKSPVSGRLKGKYSKKTGLRLVKLGAFISETASLEQNVEVIYSAQTKNSIDQEIQENEVNGSEANTLNI